MPALILALVLSAHGAAGGESKGDARYVLALDPSFGMDGGVRTTASLFSAVMLYDEALSNALHLDERLWWTKTIGVSVRALKAFFIDLTLVATTAIVTHEIFGHGARGREAGLLPTYSFAAPPPWNWLIDRNGSGYGGFTTSTFTGDGDRDAATIFAGIEANYYTAFWLTADVMQRKATLRHSDALLYLASKSTYVGSFLRLRPRAIAQSADDVEQYLVDLAYRFNKDVGDPSLRSTLFAGYFATLLDPMLWFSAWEVLVSHGYFGGHAMTVPTFTAGDLQLLPTTRYNLTPFGAEHYVDLYLFDRAFTLDLYVRAGSSGLAFYGGVGARLFRYEPLEWLRLGAELDLFVQPQTVFGARNLYDRPLIVGGNYGVSCELQIYGPLGVLGRVAYKTRGYVMGQPLDEGVHGYFGMFIRP